MSVGRSVCVLQIKKRGEMQMSPENAIKILSAGAGLKVGIMSPDNLIRLAQAAKNANVRLEIKGALSVENMVRIASAGRAHVFFDLT